MACVVRDDRQFPNRGCEFNLGSCLGERAKKPHLVRVAEHLLTVSLGQLSLRDSRVVHCHKGLVLRPKEWVLIVDLGFDAGEELVTRLVTRCEDYEVAYTR